MWHEAKRSEKKVHEMMDTARKRAMRRAEYLAKRRGDPIQAIQLLGSRCRVHKDDGLYQAAQDQIGLIPWNGKEDNLIDRFDGRALLDFIRDTSSIRGLNKSQEKSEEEEELEQFVNFERYRDLIKHRRRGFSEEEGLKHIQHELEAKMTVSLNFDKPKKPQTKGSYSQVGFSYNEKETLNPDENGDESESESDDDDEFSSDDSNDEKMERIAKDFGIKRYNWLVYMEKRGKEEEKKQKELIKGDPSIKKLSRRERRKISQTEREKERESAWFIGRGPQHDPYRDPRRSPSYESYSRRRRSRSKSRSPSHHSRRTHHESSSKSKAPKIEYITEFGVGSPRQTTSPPSSPVHSSSPVPSVSLNRSMGGQNQILEALHCDPASISRTIEQEKTPKFVKAPISVSSSAGLAKLGKSVPGGGPSKTPVGEKKETPQERLKRIMSNQLNKQIKKDTAAEQAKRREQEKERRERLAELSRLSRRSRSRSRSRDRSHSRDRSRDRSQSRDRSLSRERSRRRSRSRERSRERRRGRERSRSGSPIRRRRYSRSPRRYRTKSRSPSPRSRH